MHDRILDSGLLSIDQKAARYTQDALAKSLEVARRLGSDESHSDVTVSGLQLQPSQSRPNYLPEPFPVLNRESCLNLVLVQHLLEKTFKFHGQRIQIPTFMDHLRMAVLYRGYAILIDPSVPLSEVRERFGLLYPAIDRHKLADFVAALIHSSLGRLSLKASWGQMPLYQVGGAGTHFPAPTELGVRSRRLPWWEVKVISQPGPNQGLAGLGGDWFDSQDLECFLREKEIKLVTSYTCLAPLVEQSQVLTNPTKLMSGKCFFLKFSLYYRHIN